jgi:hypothetical protein
MVKLEEKQRKVKERFQEIADEIKDQTIYTVSLSPNSKRFFLDYVDKDSKYHKSFEDYLDMVAGKIAEELEVSGEEVTLKGVTNKLNDLEDADFLKPVEDRVFIEIPLADDLEEIEKRVKNILSL